MCVPVGVAASITTAPLKVGSINVTRPAFFALPPVREQPPRTASLTSRGVVRSIMEGVAAADHGSPAKLRHLTTLKSNPARLECQSFGGTRGISQALRAKKEVGLAKKQSSRGRKQDRARVAGGQDYEVRYEARKTGRSKAAVQKAVKKTGNSRKRVERALTR